MVPVERSQAALLGLGFRGSWIELVEPGPDAGAELAALDDRRRLTAANAARSSRGASRFAPPMLIRELRSGKIAGMVENHSIAGGVAIYVIYLDPDIGRPGYGLEATALYVSHLFDAGARLVTAEILAFNTAVTGIMRKAGWEPQARLREHVYTAGRFWDVVIYSFDREDWQRAIERYRARLPGGARRPAAFA